MEFNISFLLILFTLVGCKQTWLPEVSGYSHYAGIFGKPVTSLRISGGTEYRVHILGGGWLSPVTGNNENDSNNGYAGIDGKQIDGVAIKDATYKVHLLGGGWLPEVSGYNINDSNYGMAGSYGKSIDAIMIKDRNYATAYYSGSDQIPTDDPTPTPGKFNRNDAVTYARNHVHNINHKCGTYTDCSPASYFGSEHCGYESHGGDCANFVSQCLVLGGGHPKLNTGSCRGYPCGWEEVGAKRLGDCLREKGWTSTCGYHQSPPSNLKVGDVLIYHSGSCDNFDAHAVIVTEAGTNPKITCHSNEKLDVSYTYISDEKPYYQWLHFKD